MNYYPDESTYTQISQEELRELKSIPREEWMRQWREEIAPNNTDPAFGTDDYDDRHDQIPCHGETLQIKNRHGDDIRVIFYRPSGSEGKKLPMYFQLHGGGWCFGFAESSDDECVQYRDEVGCLVASINYRQAPNHPFPAGAEDCYDVIKYFVDHADEYGVDVEHMGIGGESAGGGLSLTVCLWAAEKKEFSIKYLALIQSIPDLYNLPDLPYPDLCYHMRLIDCYCDRKAEGMSPYISAVYATDEQLQSLPERISVLTAELDYVSITLEPFALRLAQNNREVTVRRYPGVYHCFAVKNCPAYSEEYGPSGMDFLKRQMRKALMED